MIVEILTGTLILVTVLMVACIFLQRPEANSFTSSAAETLSNILSAQSSKNPIARLTGILAILFFALSLTIAVLTSRKGGTSSLVSELTADAPAETAPPPRDKQ